MTRTDKTVLFCIGAQKAGTTWLHDVLAAHPECHIPVKEVHYFDTVSDAKRAMAVLDRLNAKVEKTTSHIAAQKRQKASVYLNRLKEHVKLVKAAVIGPDDDAEYLAFLLNGSDAKPVVGDITPAYAALSRVEFQRMANLSPNCRFLFLLRDPIDRLWSGVRMSAQMTEKRMKLDKEEASDKEFESRCLKRLDAAISAGSLSGPDRSNYMLTLSELEAVIPPEKIAIVFFENLFDQASIDEICKFIGIAPVKASAEMVKFPGRSFAFPQDRFSATYKWLAGQYDGAAAKFGDRLPSLWRDHMKQGQANG